MQPVAICVAVACIGFLVVEAIVLWQRFPLRLKTPTPRRTGAKDCSIETQAPPSLQKQPPENRDLWVYIKLPVTSPEGAAFAMLGGLWIVSNILDVLDVLHHHASKKHGVRIVWGMKGASAQGLTEWWAHCGKYVKETILQQPGWTFQEATEDLLRHFSRYNATVVTMDSFKGPKDVEQAIQNAFSEFMYATSVVCIQGMCRAAWWLTHKPKPQTSSEQGTRRRSLAFRCLQALTSAVQRRQGSLLQQSLLPTSQPRPTMILVGSQDHLPSSDLRPCPFLSSTLFAIRSALLNNDEDACIVCLGQFHPDDEHQITSLVNNTNNHHVIMARNLHMDASIANWMTTAQEVFLLGDMPWAYWYCHAVLTRPSVHTKTFITFPYAPLMSLTSTNPMDIGSTTSLFPKHPNFMYFSGNTEETNTEARTQQ